MNPICINNNKFTTNNNIFIDLVIYEKVIEEQEASQIALEVPFERKDMNNDRTIIMT
jgi:hypothetical protein